MEQVIKQILELTKKTESRFYELEELIYAPEIIAHNSLWRKYVKERDSLAEIVQKSNELEKCLADLNECRKHLLEVSDNQIKELLNQEITDLNNKIIELSKKIKSMLAPQVENDNKNVTLEIKVEDKTYGSAIFAEKIIKMYQSYAELKKCVFQIKSCSNNENNLIKHAVVQISGTGIYSRLQYETGIHKAVGLDAKVNYNNVKVSVYPIIELKQKIIDSKEIRTDIFHSGGAGGQNVNKVETAVRLTHYPTNIVATCQDERSQLKNKERAMKTLQTKVNEYYQQKQLKEISQQKKKLQNNKNIRVYNFITNKVWDSATNISMDLDTVIDGNIDNLIDARILNQS